VVERVSVFFPEGFQGNEAWGTEEFVVDFRAWADCDGGRPIWMPFLNFQGGGII
jgi:hypothetical protein